MSRCISSHGEYSEHTFLPSGPATRGEDRFTCTLCGDFDEWAAVEALLAAEAIAEAAREYVRVLDAWACGEGGSRAAAWYALIAAIDAEREAQSRPDAHTNPQP